MSSESVFVAMVLREVRAARDVDGAWDAEAKDGAPILWLAEAGEVLADLRAAVSALDAAEDPK